MAFCAKISKIFKILLFELNPFNGFLSSWFFIPEAAQAWRCSIWVICCDLTFCPRLLRIVLQSRLLITHDSSRLSWLITIFMTDHRMYDHSRNNWSHQSERWISKSPWTQIWAGIKCRYVEFHKSTLDKTGKVRILKITSDWDLTKFQPFLTRQKTQRSRRVAFKPLKLFSNFEEPNLKQENQTQCWFSNP